MSNADVVFTALFGGYETLNELSHDSSPNTRYICFTDNRNLRSLSWEIKTVKPTILDNPARSSRAIKMLGHHYFKKGTRLLYIDNTVKLKVDGSIILNEWLEDSQLALMHHSSRRTVRGEFFACAAYGLDAQEKIREQYLHYKRDFPEVLKEQPYWGGMIARVNSESTDRFMESWNSEFIRFTKRDQLSINVASKVSGVEIHSVSGRNDDTKWHQWPIISSRKTEMRDTTSNTNYRRLKIVENTFRHGFRFYFPTIP